MDIFKPADIFAKFVVNNVFGLNEGSKIAESLNFFIYDTIKISILIFFMSFIAGVIKTYFDAEKTKAFLSGKHRGLGNALAALLGIVTPFCSCSAVPFFIGFVEAGVPLGITFSFLISAPMINEMALVILFGLFGLKIAGIYVISGLIIAIFGGMLIGFLKLEKYIEPIAFEQKAPEKSSCCCQCSKTEINFKYRLKQGAAHSINIYKSVILYVIIGVAVGAFVHNYVPTELLLKYAGNTNPLAVPLAVLLGIPLYAGCAGMLPIAYVLFKSGLPIGTVLAFSMAVTAVSFPEFIILRKVLKPKMLAIFAGIMLLGIIFTGYLFNLIL